MPSKRIQNMLQLRVSLTHSHSQCYEGTLITYKFDSKKKYESYCHPRGYQGEDENEEYGNITNEHQLWDYHLTFEPEFYTARAKEDYYRETYEKKKQRQENIDSAVNLPEVNLEEYDAGYDVNDEKFDEMYNEAMKTAGTGGRDYGPPAEQNVDGFGPTSNADLSGNNNSATARKGQRTPTTGNKPVAKPRNKRNGDTLTARTRMNIQQPSSL